MADLSVWRHADFENTTENWGPQPILQTRVLPLMYPGGTESLKEKENKMASGSDFTTVPEQKYECKLFWPASAYMIEIMKHNF